MNRSVALLLLMLSPAATRAYADDAPIDADDIGGVVTSRLGPEAGVWVIAETTELGVRFAKTVVTDEKGGYSDAPGATPET